MRAIQITLLILGHLLMSAHAAIPSIDGTGSALIFPYYTVNGGHDTLVSLANSTTQVKALKLRFFDGDYGKEVFDLNLYLAPRDVWTAVIFKDGDRGAKLLSPDKSCTYPSLALGGQNFRTTNFTEIDNGKIVNNSPLRTIEGHIEVYEMGNVVLPELKAALSHTTVNGVRAPSNCGALTGVFDAAGKLETVYENAVNAPTGGLWGSATLVNAGAGTSVSYDAEALNQVHKGSQHTGPGAVNPNMENAEPEVRFADATGIYSAQFSGPQGGVNAMAALWMRSNVQTEWITDPSIKAGTDLVITMPTKKHSMGCGPTANAPFTYISSCQLFFRTLPEEMRNNIYDQEERTTSTPLDFTKTHDGTSKVLPATIYPVLVWSVNVVTINNSYMLGSRLGFNQNSPASIGSSGWLDIDLKGKYNNSERALFSVPGATRNGVACGSLKMLGLPVLGQTFTKFVNGAIGTPPVLSNYANANALKYKRALICQ